MQGKIFIPEKTEKVELRAGCLDLGKLTRELADELRWSDLVPLILAVPKLARFLQPGCL